MRDLTRGPIGGHLAAMAAPANLHHMPQLLALGLLLLGACGPARSAQAPEAPLAPREPHELEAHGDVRVDPYFWMRERDDPRVLAHLEAENEYFARMTAHLAPRRDEILADLRERQPLEAPLAPFEQAGSLVYGRADAEREYPVYYRRRATAEGWGPEEVILDVNRVAEGHAYCRVRLDGLDPSGRYLAYIADTSGSGRFTLRFVDLETDRTLEDAVDGVIGGAVFGTTVFPAAVWSADSRYVFYARQVPGDMRLDSIYRHRLGTESGEDTLVFRETDPRFWALVTTTKARDLIVVYAISTDTTEVRVLAADRPESEPRLLFSRNDGHEYWVDSRGGGEIVVRTNRGASSYRVAAAPLEDPAPESWREVRSGRDGVLVEAMDLLQGHVVVVERREARPEIWAVALADGAVTRIPLDEAACQVRFAQRHRLEETKVRFEYTSLTTPKRLVSHDLATGEARAETELQRLDGYRPADYVSESLWAPARDGARIPVSLVSRRSQRPGPRPLLLFGYGAYGVTVDPAFAAERVGLLDRGFVYAIAHVRGGQALGRDWYEQGRGLAKKNTFADFVDVARYLVESGRTAPDRLFATSASAGGATVGASLNMAPSLFRAAVLRVPALDFVTSMSDPSIPLVTGEYGEWGDPTNRDEYFAMKSWSPYDNIEAKAYPRIMVLAGFHDRQVMYWEPAKWVAKLRATKTDDHPLLLRMDMDSGHGGASARGRRLEDEALIQAFLVDLAPED